MGKLSDFNDLAQVAGPQVVKAALDQVLAAAPAEVPTPAESAPRWDNPPDPVLPGMIKTPEIPTDILPTWVGAMCQAVAASTQTPPALSVMVALGVLGAVLQREFEVAPFDDDYREPLSIWTVVAMLSGSRKSAVFKAMTEVLVKWERLEYDRGRAERGRAASARKVAEKRIERLLMDASKAKDDHEREQLRAAIQHEKDTMPAELHAPRVFVDDITAERLQALLVEQGERVAVLSDEAGIFQILGGLYSGGAANLDVFLKGHAGTAMRVDRAGRSAHVDKPALSFALAIQNGVLGEVAASTRFRDTGLLARFLYAIPESNVGKRDVRLRQAVPERIRDDYEAGIFKLLEGRKVVPEAPRVLPMTPPALDLWADFAQAIEDQQGEGGLYESISDWTSKLPGAVARVAALIELAEMGRHAEEVSELAVSKAVQLGLLLIPHAQAAFGVVGLDQADADGLAVVKWAKGNGLDQFSKRDCQKSLSGRFRTQDRLNAALQRLQQKDVVRLYTRRNKGAVATEVVIMNPKLLS